MASGNYIRTTSRSLSIEVQSKVPARATRQLPVLEDVADEEMEEELAEAEESLPQQLPGRARPELIEEGYGSRPLVSHPSWRSPWIICTIVAILFVIVLLSAGMFQRSDYAQVTYNNNGGQAYDVQVGGTQAGSWQKDQPQPAKAPIPSQAGPYSVLTKPSISVDFINKVLDAYHSPAAGKGQTLYDMGVKYNIDPAFALAFFMHESTFGTRGEARSSLSLGNLRCIPNFRCIDNYAWFNTWEDGFQAWYELIRNWYVANWGLTTVDQIIPKYAPNSDNNNEAGYIQALKHYIDTWHAGIPVVA